MRISDWSSDVCSSDLRSTVTDNVVVASDSTGKCAGPGSADARSELGSGRNDARHGQHATSAKPPRLLHQVRAGMRRLGMAVRSCAALAQRWTPRNAGTNPVTPISTVQIGTTALREGGVK